MSFNSCSINSFTINTLCGSRRAAIIDSIKPVTPISGNKTHPYQSKINYSHDIQYVDPKTIESSIIGIQIELGGVTQTASFEIKNDIMPMLAISKFTCDSNIEEQVNISNISVKVLEQ